MSCDIVAMCAAAAGEMNCIGICVRGFTPARLTTGWAPPVAAGSGVPTVAKVTGIAVAGCCGATAAGELVAVDATKLVIAGTVVAVAMGDCCTVGAVLPTEVLPAPSNLIPLRLCIPSEPATEDDISLLRAARVWACWAA